MDIDGGAYLWTLGSLGSLSNPDPGLARLVLVKRVFSDNVSLVYVGLEIGSI